MKIYHSHHIYRINELPFAEVETEFTCCGNKHGVGNCRGLGDGNGTLGDGTCYADMFGMGHGEGVDCGSCEND